MSQSVSEINDKLKIFSDKFAEQKNFGKNYAFSTTNKEEEQRAEESALIALTNRFPQGVTMYGYRAKSSDTALDKDRKQMDLHPYTKQGSGVSCTVAYTDAESGEIVYLLCKKKNRNMYTQIGGYTKGQGPEGSEIIVDTRSDDQRDNDEEALIGNMNAINVTEKTAKPLNIAYTLEALKVKSVSGFMDQQKQFPGKLIDPSLMKKQLKSQGIDYPFDFNALDTALRELKEETQLDLSGKCQASELFTADDFGISNEDQRLHTKVTHYLFYLGKRTQKEILELFPVKAGSDIELLKWVSLSSFERALDLKEIKIKNDLPVYMPYAIQTLYRATKQIRYKELRACSDNVYSKHKNVEAQLVRHLNKLGQNIENVLPKVCWDPYDVNSHKYHLAILVTADYLMQVHYAGRVFNLEELKVNLKQVTHAQEKFLSTTLLVRN